MELAAPEDAPPGYRFKPTARELIHHYLYPWVASVPGQTTTFGESEGIVCAADVYGADPGTLTSQLRDYGHDDGNWYFLCVARWKDGNVGTRMNRAVRGGGTWHGSGKRIAVRRWPGGYRQTFEYRDAGGGKSAWLMEEFGSGVPEASDAEGVKVLCRVHRTPRAAADNDDDGEERQDDDTSSMAAQYKRQRRQELDLAAAQYWAATAMVPAPPDVECSYASTSQMAAPATAAAAALTVWQQQPPMMEQGVGYHCTGINGGDEGIKEEQEPSEMLAPDMGWQQFVEMGYGFNYADENAQLNEWMQGTFSCPKPSDDATQEQDDPCRDDATGS